MSKEFDTSKIYYRFLEAKYALDSIEKRRLYISRFGDLNDVNDGIVGFRRQSEDPKVEMSGFKLYANLYRALFGMISFTGNCVDPVLWGHYGDRGYGIALGYRVPVKLKDFDPHLKFGSWFTRVKYGEKRPAIEDHDVADVFLNLELQKKDGSEDAAKRILNGPAMHRILGALWESLFTKSKSWEYEDEYRALIEFSKSLPRE